MKRYRFFSIAGIVAVLLAVVLPIAAVAAELVMDIDIKPDKETNVLNVMQPSLLPVAVYYGNNAIDETSITLQGVPAASYLYRYNYLLVKFDAKAVIGMLGNVSNGQVIELTLEGELEDGTSFVGYDDVVILRRGSH